MNDYLQDYYLWGYKMKYFLPFLISLFLFTNSALANKICPQDWKHSLYFDYQNNIATIESHISNIRDLKDLESEVKNGIPFTASYLEISKNAKRFELLATFDSFRNGRRAYIGSRQILFPKVTLPIGKVLQSLEVFNPYSHKPTVCYNIELYENVSLREVYEVIREGGWIGGFMAKPYRLANINIEFQESSRSTLNLFSLYSE